jgi:SAM-dependent methyltransferase
MAVDVNTRVKRGLRRAYETGARLYLAPILKREWEFPPIRELREYVFQFEFAMRAVARHMPREVLDAGSGMSAWPHLLASCGVRVTATDEIDGYWGSMFNRHYYVQQDDITETRLHRQYDMVTCLGVVTCIEGDRAALRNLFALVKPGGHIVVTCAYRRNEPVPNAYAIPGASYNQPFICRMYSQAEIDGWLAENGGELELQEHFRVFTGEYWAHGRRLEPPVRCVPEEAQYTALCIRKALTG